MRTERPNRARAGLDRPGRRLATLAPLLALAGCSQLWRPLGEEYGRPGGPVPVAEAAPPLAEPPRVILTGTIEQRYPNVRFLQHGDNDFTAFLTVPAGTGQAVAARVKEYVACDDRPERPAEIRVETSDDKAAQLAGTVFLGSQRAPAVEGVVRPAAGGTLSAVEDYLVVRGTESDIEEVIKSIDFFFNDGPQIEIQAQIVELTDSTLFERGIVPVNPATPLLRNNSGVGPGGEGPFLRAIGGSFPTATGQNLGGTAGSGLAGQISILQNELQLQALIQLLESTEGVDIVSRPRVVVRNGVTADLSSAERIPFLKATQIGVQGVTTTSVDYQNVGVNLYVLPFFLGGDTVHMVIEASVSRLGRNILLATDASGNPFFSSSINTRSARTSVSVRSGQPVVIGGLKLKELRQTENKVPLLGDVPLLKYLFSSESEEEVDTEVLFVITPIVKRRGPSISPFGDIFDPFSPAPGSP